MIHSRNHLISASAGALLALALLMSGRSPALAQGGATLAASPTRVPPGGTLTAAWNGTAAPTSTVRVGLYRPGNSRLLYGADLYATGPNNGCVPFVLPAGVDPGTYELRLFDSGGRTPLATSNLFTVEARVPHLTASPVLRSPGGTISATWGDIPAPTAGDWVGLFVPGARDADVVLRRSIEATVFGTVPFVLPAALPPGTYELRLFGNNGMTLLAVSNQFKIEPRTPGLTISHTRVPPGGTLTAAWSDTAASTSTVRLGLYRPGNTRLLYGADLYATGPNSGSVLFVLPAGIDPGTYELRLFDTARSASLLAISNRFTVEARIPSLTASPDRRQPGGTVSATWSGVPAPTADDWVGLYVPGTDNDHPVAGRPTEGTVFGTVPFLLPATLPPGSYELRLLAHHRQTLLATSNRFIVEPGTPSLTISTTHVPPGGTLSAIWTDTAASTSRVSLGLYVPGSTRLSYGANLSAEGAAAGSVLFTLPVGIQPGTYELRLSDTRQTRLATSNRFTVEPNIPSMTVGSVRHRPGSVVSVAWSRIPSPTAADWIGLFAPGAEDSAPLVQPLPTNGTTHGSATLPLPATLAPGTYELRLFANAGASRLATSNAFLVTLN